MPGASLMRSAFLLLTLSLAMLPAAAQDVAPLIEPGRNHQW